MIRPRTSLPARPRAALSGRLVDLRQIVATYGDIPLRVLARDLAADSARDDMPAHVPARIPARTLDVQRT